MLPSVPFVDDEVTSQQVLERWKCSTRESSAQNVGFAGRVAPATDFRKDRV